MAEPEALTIARHAAVDADDRLRYTYTAESFPETIALDVELLPCIDGDVLDAFVRYVVKCANGIATYEYRSGDPVQGSALVMQRVRFKEIKLV